jgi:tocopherol O-methyltransferase
MGRGNRLSNMTPQQPITVGAIRGHYDRLSVLYRAFWGEHIHHGFWNGARTPKEAQIALIEKLAAVAHVRHGSAVLDIGCGLGGSSLWLARNLGCSVLGLTISPVQLKMASRRAAKQRLAERVRFRLEDANSLTYESAFDCVWIIECSEHIFDKAAFFRRAASALRPGGVLALCAWVRRDGELSPTENDLIARVCRGMLCPSLASIREYCEWMMKAGLSVQTAEDIATGVSETWAVCRKIARRPVVRKILKSAESQTLQFVRSFDDMAEAYETGAMGYGMFTAVKVKEPARK